MTVKEFVSLYANIGNVDKIYVLSDGMMLEYDIAFTSWRDEVADMVETLGDRIIDDFIITADSMGSIHLNINLKEGDNNA